MNAIESRKLSSVGLPVRLMLAGLLLSPASPLSAAPQQQQGQQQPSSATESTTNDDSATPTRPAQDAAAQDAVAQHADDESAALGVVVASCPGDGVCVTDTILGSPADQAGTRQGDYILAVGDQQVSSPLQLRDLIQKQRAGQQVNLTLWRQGAEMTKQVVLAAESKELPPSHRAYLGIALSDGDQAGITIAQVQDNSPAKEAGLRAGDVITRLNGEEVGSIEQFIDKVQDFGPGAQLKITLQRDGAEQLIAVTLGKVDEAPMQWLRQAFRPPMEDFERNVPRPGGFGSEPMMDETLDQLRQEVRELREQINELKRQLPQNQPAADQEASLSQPIETANSVAGASLSSATTLVMQRGDRDAARFGTRGRYGRQGYDRFDRGWNRDWYRRGPVDRSPNYGHSYYNYRGRPYYYGGPRGYGYGPRYGLRIGRNFGLYWY